MIKYMNYSPKLKQPICINITYCLDIMNIYENYLFFNTVVSQ